MSFTVRAVAITDWMAQRIEILDLLLGLIRDLHRIINTTECRLTMYAFAAGSNMETMTIRERHLLLRLLNTADNGFKADASGSVQRIARQGGN